MLGLGVMGGSFARAVSDIEGQTEVVGWSPSESERLDALAARAVTQVADSWEAAVHGADLVMLAMPLSATVRMIEVLPAQLHPDATVSDVASLKAPVARAAHDAGLAARWVGCHPMVGSERSGFDASKGDLYANAAVWIVSEPNAAARRERLESLWSRLGATVAGTEVEPHDRMMALVSHLPQLTANALATALARGGVSPDQLGSGGRDMTRLAASDPGMWRDIFAAAPPELIAGLGELADELEAITGELRSGDIEAVVRRMERTRAWRSGA